MPNVNYPIPQNMEGVTRGAYRTPFHWGRFGSDVLRGQILPPEFSVPLNVIDRLSGHHGRNTVDRWFGATQNRQLQDENNYMRRLMRSDPGNRSGISRFLENLFGGNRRQRGNSSTPPMPEQQSGGGAETFPYVDTWGSPPVPSGNNSSGNRRLGIGRNVYFFPSLYRTINGGRFQDDHDAMIALGDELAGANIPRIF